MKAVTVENPQGPAVIQERPLPKLRPGYLLVKTVAVGLNPVDGTFLNLGIAIPGSLMGCDYSGIVEAVGEGVQRSFKKGDRICGGTRPLDPHNTEMGTFAEYIVVKADVQLHIPDHMSFEEAATLGVTNLTTGRYFFDKFKIPYPEVLEDGTVNTSQLPKRLLFVYGGSSAMGTMAIQWAKLANFYVLTTSSQHNTDMVKSYGADEIVDHYSSTGPEDILSIIANKKLSEKMGNLTLSLDNIGNAQSTEFCAKVLNPTQTSTPNEELKYSVILPWTPEFPGITKFVTLGYSFLGEPWEQFGQMNEASPEDFESAMRFAILAEKMLAKGLIKPHPVEVRDGGLEGVIGAGLDDTKAKRVSGKKLVYRM